MTVRKTFNTKTDGVKRRMGSGLAIMHSSGVLNVGLQDLTPWVGALLSRREDLLARGFMAAARRAPSGTANVLVDRSNTAMTQLLSLC